MEVDLDIDNYNLEELLNLFNLDYHFTESNLKDAYKIVYKLHPDKSKLDKKYFLFYMKAIKIIRNLYDIRVDKRKKNLNEEIKIDLNEDEIKNKMKTKNFNKWFNDMFEKYKIKNEDDEGYDNWLKSNENVDNVKISNMNEMNEHFQKKKKETRELTIYNKEEELISEGISSSNLYNKKPESYNSGLFSKLQYDDLKKVHTQSVVPVTDDDYIKKEKFRNISDYKMHRDSQNVTPLSKIESDKILNTRRSNQEIEDLNRAYYLHKQEETVIKNNKEFIRQFKMIKN